LPVSYDSQIVDHNGRATSVVEPVDEIAVHAGEATVEERSGPAPTRFQPSDEFVG
jgi:hypothetical protein